MADIPSATSQQIQQTGSSQNGVTSTTIRVEVLQGQFRSYKICVFNQILKQLSIQVGFLSSGTRSECICSCPLWSKKVLGVLTSLLLTTDFSNPLVRLNFWVRCPKRPKAAQPLQEHAARSRRDCSRFLYAPYSNASPIGWILSHLVGFSNS